MPKVIQAALMAISMVVGMGIGASSCNSTSGNTHVREDSCCGLGDSKPEPPRVAHAVNIRPSDIKERSYSDEDGRSYLIHYYESEERSEVLHGVCYVRGRTYIERKDYVHGELDGLWVTMDLSGVVFSVDSYRRGKQHGLSLLWGENGELQKASTYSHGNLDGVTVSFDSERLLMEQSAFSSGSLQGVSREWNDPTSDWPAFEKWYFKGKLNGWSAKWTPEGTLRDVELWEDGKLVRTE